jgi:predicted Zn-dependent peptidase/outer membrane lipoprotein-sorting protein
MHRFLPRYCVVSSVAALLLAVLVAWPVQAQEIGTSDYDVDNLTYPELGEIDTPEPRRVELENGLIIFLLEDDELPLISASARVGTGSVYEPAEMVGLASVTGTVMRTGGTASMSADSINQVLERLGASVESGIGSTSGSVSMSTLSEHVDRVLPIFADVLRQPAFAQDKIDLAKNQQTSAIARRNDTAPSIAAREMNKLIYGADSPYARTTEYYTIDRIERDNVVNFYETYFYPNNTMLSVWGDFDADAMEERLREAFGDWQPADDFERPMPPEPTATRTRSVNLVQKDDVTQSSVRMGHIGELRRDSEDYPATQVMSRVLGASFTGRLFRNLRTDQGLAYATGGVYSAGYTAPRAFFALVRTQNNSTVEAAQGMIDNVRSMQTDAPTDEEVNRAKDSYLNSFVFNFDTESEILGRQMTYEYYGYPSDFLEQTRRGIQDVTPDDVYRAAQQYLHPDESHILVVGRQEDFDQDLSVLTEDGGTVNEIDISIPQNPPGEAPAVSAEDMAAGREMVMAAREALGGSAFDDIDNMRIVTQQQGNSSTLVVNLPDQLRTDINTPMGELTVVDNGQSIQLRTPQGVQSAPPQLRSQINSQLWRSLPYLMARLDHDDLSFESQGEATVDGTTYQAVRVQPPAGDAYTLYLDPGSQRPQQLRFQTINPQSGQQIQITQAFSDYQEVDGITVPFQTVTTQSMGEQEQTIEATIQTLEVNADLEDGLFTLDAE